MMNIEPQAPRFSFEQVEGVTRAVIPAKRSWFSLIFLSAWLVGWAFGEVTAMRTLITPNAGGTTLFMVAWLVGWTVGGGFALATVLWQLGGREIVSVDGTTLEHRVEAVGIGRSRKYKITAVKNLRATECDGSTRNSQAAFMPSIAGQGSGPVAFDYGARTFRLGAALDEAEARVLVQRLSSRLPQRLSEVS